MDGWTGAAESRYKGKTKQSVGDWFAKGRLPSVFVIHVKRIVITRHPRKIDHIGLGDRPTPAFPLVTNPQVIEVHGEPHPQHSFAEVRVESGLLEGVIFRGRQLERKSDQANSASAASNTIVTNSKSGKVPAHG